LTPTADSGAAPARRAFGAASTALVDWLRAGRGDPTPRGLLRYRWNRPFFEWNLAMQRKLLPPAPLPRDPAWILGLWRSGTTALHDALCAASDLATPRTWQCMAPASFAITGRPRTAARQPRPMDDLVIGTDSPQEDEFAWLLLGGDSAYRAFLDPSRLPELAATLDPRRWRTRPWPAEDRWRTFLGQVGAQDGRGRRLLLKSPNHTFRALGLLDRFPSSSFVWITREPDAIVRSNLKMWRSMIELYALRPLPPALLEDFIGQALAQAAGVLDALREICPREQLVVVRQEDLLADPDPLVRGVLSRWNATGTCAPPAFTGTPPEATTAPSGAVQDLLRRAQQRALASHGL